MGTLVALRDFRNAGSAPFFDRRELRAILALYAERVSRGEWRDYAIEQQPRHAGFAVFRSSRDWPLYVIAKYRPRAALLGGEGSAQHCEVLVASARLGHPAGARDYHDLAGAGGA
ncbi:MAG: DUF2794 domain-containing protein, partial [Alphaproteobacteria bacterium]